MAPDGYHRTYTGMAYCAVSNRFSFDAIFMCRKEEANKGGGGAGGRGSFGVLGGLSSHEKLDVTKGERGGECVCYLGAVLSGSEEEEESDPGKVCDCFSSRQSALGD